MRFLVDECTGPAVAHWLRDNGHDVCSIYEDAPGANDTEVIEKAYAENRILITNDKDFGEKVFREGYLHHGVVLLRLADERSTNKINVLEKLLDQYQGQLKNKFTVVTQKHVRFGQEF